MNTSTNIDTCYASPSFYRRIMLKFRFEIPSQWWETAKYIGDYFLCRTL